jgi:transcriptional/translational regulatory protein YebC/TACO1
MARVKACAILFLDSSRKARIMQIAESKGIEPMAAAIMYTIGALKNAKRRGTARNFNEALESLEFEQVGDRGSRITRTISADNTSRTINRINRTNEGERFTVDGTHYVYDYDNVFVIDGEICAIPHFTIVDKEKPESTGRAIGKVLGTLYVQWEEKEAQSDPMAIYADKEKITIYNNVNANLTKFFADYKARLSKTSQNRLVDIANTTLSVDYLTSRIARNDPESSKLAWAAKYLHDKFPHKDAISCKEFIGHIKAYIPA